MNEQEEALSTFRTELERVIEDFTRDWLWAMDRLMFGPVGTVAEELFAGLQKRQTENLSLVEMCRRMRQQHDDDLTRILAEENSMLTELKEWRS